jgi:hypothetical protein
MADDPLDERPHHGYFPVTPFERYRNLLNFRFGEDPLGMLGSWTV